MKPIPEYDGYYATEHGEIISLKNTEPRTLAQSIDKTDGYRKVRVYQDGKRRLRFVHRLTLMAFKGLPLTPKYETRHLNGNPADNHISNLEWGTPKENSADRAKHGRDHNHSKLTAEQVIEIRQRLAKHESLASIGRAFNVAYQNIRAIRNGVTWKHL